MNASDVTQPREVTDVRELLELADLTAVNAYEVAGRRVDSSDLPPEGSPREQVKVAARGSDTEIETRVRMERYTDDAFLVADIGVAYAFSEPLNINQATLTEFVERVGMMAVFPFLRESLVTTASRLGVDVPVLGLLRAGTFRVEASSDSDAPEDVPAGD